MMYLRNAQRTRVSISSGARGVRRCRRRGRDSSGARIRSNRKFHPLPGWQRATLRTRLAVEQVDSPSRTKRRTSASKRERDRECPSLPFAGEEIGAAGMSEATLPSTSEVVEAQPPRFRTVGVAAATAVAAATGSALLIPRRLGRGLGVRTRRGIPGFELVPPTKSIAPVRPPPREEPRYFPSCGAS